MSERRRTGIKLALASAVIALSGFGVGLAAEPADDLSEQVVAVGKVERQVITVGGGGGAYDDGRCDKDAPQRQAAPPAI
jgi:hypothetical protein